MTDGGQSEQWTVVKRVPTRTQRCRDFAAALRAHPPGTCLDAADIAGEFRTADAAKSFAWRVNHGKAVAFRPAGDYFAESEGTRVSVTYRGPRTQARRAS